MLRERKKFRHSPIYSIFAPTSLSFPSFCALLIFFYILPWQFLNSLLFLSFLLSQNVLFAIADAFLMYVNHFKLYSSFCASHSKAQKALHPSETSQKVSHKIAVKKSKCFQTKATRPCRSS